MAELQPDEKLVVSMLKTFGGALSLKELAETFASEANPAEELASKLVPVLVAAMRKGLIDQDGELYLLNLEGLDLCADSSSESDAIENEID